MHATLVSLSWRQDKNSNLAHWVNCLRLGEQLDYIKDFATNVQPLLEAMENEQF